MEQSKQEKEIYELAELLMQSENIEASAIILRDFADGVYVLRVDDNGTVSSTRVVKR